MSHRSTLLRRLYLAGLGVLTLLTLILRTLSLYRHLDPIGYFDGSALPTLTTIFLVWGIALCIACPFLLFKKGEVEALPPAALADKIAALVAAIATAVATVLLASTVRPTDQSLLTVLGVIALLCGTGYFIARLKYVTGATALLSFGVILSAILLISLTYFDLTVPMNSPHKLSLHLCLLACAVYLLYEMRLAVSTPFPRVLVMAASLCTLLTVSMSGSNLILALRDATGMLYLAGNLLALAVGLCAAWRLIGLLLPSTPLQEETEEVEV